jgi:hypothetical protein
MADIPYISCMSSETKEHHMLHIFADALLIATRQSPMPRHATAPRPTPKAEEATTRRWFSFSGIKL